MLNKNNCQGAKTITNTIHLFVDSLHKTL